MAIKPLKIALVGAGPASLTLGAILTHNSIPFTIYEVSTSLRHAGGSLDLHPTTGQAALKEAGLWKQFVKHARPESDVIKIVELKTGEVLWDGNGADKQDHGTSEEELFSGRPEIDRGALMQITFDSLPEGSVQWGKKLERVVPSATQQDKHDLHFSDGSQQVDFDLVIGGDGAWSKVRSLLTPVRPQYSGISLIEAWHSDVKSNAWLLDYVGAGSLMSLGKDTAVISQRQGDGSLRSYGCVRVPEDFITTCGIDWSNRDQAREDFISRYLENVDESLKRVLRECKEHLTARALYELPVPFTFPHRKGVTLIGDAAHLMTPFAGLGVNVGMTDALVLAREIIAVCKDERGLDEGLLAYEKEMFPRAQKSMEKTMRNKQSQFSEGGSRGFADTIRSVVEASMTQSEVPKSMHTEPVDTKA